MRKAGTILCILLLAGFALAGQTNVGKATTDAISAPTLINYQGKLTDATGTPISGNKHFVFNIYDAATGGTLIWGPEDWPAVTVTQGVFNVILGTNTPPGGVAIPDGPDCYLEITVEGVVIAPRVQLVSAPYAMKSNDAGMLGGQAPAAYEQVANKNANNGYAGLNATAKLPLGRIDQGGATNGQVLTWNNAGSTWAPATSSGGVTGSGTTGYIPRWTSSSALGNSSMQDDASGHVGVGSAYNSNYAVYGYNSSSGGTSYAGMYGYGYYNGVYGYSAGYSTVGALACYNNGYPCGVYGYGSSYYGVYGYTAGSYPAVYGYSTGSGYGCYGYCSQYGQMGILAPYYYSVGNYPVGIYGTSNYQGIYGYSGYGYTYGVLGCYGNPTSAGVYGYGGTSGYPGGYFGNSSGYYAEVAYSSYKIYGSGSVSTYIIDENDRERTLHCPEAPGVMFEDYGSAQLTNGHVRVEIDPLLLRGITISAEYPLHVYVTPNGTEPVALSVQKGQTYFDVYGPAASNVAFDWRIVANRKNYEYQRFEAHERPAWLKGKPEMTPKEVDALLTREQTSHPVPPVPVPSTVQSPNVNPQPKSLGN